MTDDTDYSVLLNLFIQLVESQAGIKIEDVSGSWLHDAQVLAIKLFRHLASMQSLARISVFTTENGLTAHFVDHASVKVIARAALETYLVFFYLYGSSDNSLCIFRHKTWKLGGLADRQKLHASTKEAKEKLIQEKNQILDLQLDIQAHSQMNEYSEKQRIKLMEGEWRIGKGWSDLASQAGFHKKYFDNIYGYLCGYSHSSYISALQVGQAQSIKEQQMLTKSILGIGAVLMAHFSFSYAAKFNNANVVLCANTSAKNVAEKWRFGHKDMESIYGGSFETPVK